MLFLGAVLESEPKMLISEFLDGGSLEDYYENQERVKGRCVDRTHTHTHKHTHTHIHTHTLTYMYAYK